MITLKLCSSIYISRFILVFQTIESDPKCLLVKTRFYYMAIKLYLQQLNVDKCRKLNQSLFQNQK